MDPCRSALVPPERIRRWFENFESRHGRTDLTVVGDRLVATAADRDEAVAALPFGRRYDGPADAAAFAEAAGESIPWGVLLVRKGGFAVASLEGPTVLASKVGRRHVQGRTKAGGQSQQRFARRRDNQARQAFEAAAEHAHRILVNESTLLVRALVCGGDRSAVEAVLSDPRLKHLSVVRTEPWLAVPDPRRAVLDQAIVDARSARITLRSAGDDLTGLA
ncbi:MAG TPA: acVLRF1 family peptidyl-tRNA hydrolase [Nocardioidaceae bacterium]|nr:acVLRF1 family peptidyl-tRNA hydrolase [Nocardioidaceae bacterium]